MKKNGNPPQTQARGARVGGLTLPAVLLLVVAAGWLVVQLLGPRVTQLPMVMHFVIFFAITAGCAFTGHLVLRLLPAGQLDLLEQAALGFAVGLAILIFGTLALGLAGLMTALPGLIVFLILVGAVGYLRWRRDMTARCEDTIVPANAAAAPSPSAAAPPLATPAPASSLATPAAAPLAEGLDWCRGRWLLTGLAVAVAAVLLYAAWGQPTEYDVCEYHAGVPAEWYRAGRITDLPHNVYSYFPFGAEMIYLAALGLVPQYQADAAGQPAMIGGEPLVNLGPAAALGKLLIASCTVWAALLLVAVGRRLFSLRAGVAAALLYLLVPWVFQVAGLGYVEGVLNFYTAAALLGFVILMKETARRRDESRRDERRQAAAPRSSRSAAQAPLARPAAAAPSLAGLAILTGLMVGLTLSIKQTSFGFVLLPALAVTLWLAARDRLGWRPAALLLATAALVGAPFYLRNLILTGNPLFPLLGSWFAATPNWPRDLADRFAHFHSAHGFSLAAWRAALIGPADASPGDWPSFYYCAAVLLAAPLALLRADYRRRALALLGLVAMMVVMWFVVTHRIPRLLLPAWLLLALPAGAGLVSLKTAWLRRGVIVVVAALLAMDFTLDLRLLEDQALRLRMIEDSAAEFVPARGYDFRFPPPAAADLWNYSPYATRMVNDLATGEGLGGGPAAAGRGLSAGGPPLRVGLVGEAEPLYFAVPIIYNTVFNRPWLEPTAEELAALPPGPAPGDTASPASPAASADLAPRYLAALPARLARLGVTHIYVNWKEVHRFRQPGNYGWPAWLDEQFFADAEQRGTLRKVWAFGESGAAPAHVLYEVAVPGSAK